MALAAVLVFRDVRPSSGGLAVDVRDIANGLAARGHAIRVVSTAGAPRSLNGWFDPAVQQVPLPHIGPPGVGDVFGLSRGVGRAIPGCERHVVHVYSWLPVYLHFAAMAIARARGHSVVWTPMLAPGRETLWKHRGLAGRAMMVFDRWAPRAARWVDAVVAATPSEAHEFERAGARRVVLIPPSVASTPVVPREKAERLRARLGLERYPVVLMVAARRERRKGLGFALRVFQRLLASIPDARLVIAGTAADELPAAQNVVGVGRLSDDDLRAAYRAADVVFVPSLYEAFSRIVIEAWQQETAVVVTDGVGLAGMVAERAAGYVVSSGDVEGARAALEEALASPAATAQAAARGRAMVDSRFSVDDAVSKMEVLYRELAQAQ